MNNIPIIDLFAGPGGLGEGFMSLMNGNVSVFDIKLSIEKDESAHKTLTWRSFYRQFKKNGKEVPDEYYQAIEETDLSIREKIIEAALYKYPEGKIARHEAQLVELGSAEWPAERVDKLIRERLGDRRNWLLIGGPPCQAYSSAGRSRVGGIDPKDHRVYLYKEYLRIITQHKPAIFVMENVKGLLSAKVGEEKVFDWIKKDLSVDGHYKIHSFVKPVEYDKDYLIKCEDYGIPQKRHRVILLGVRHDINYKPIYLTKKVKVNLRSVIDTLPPLRSGITKTFINYHKNEKYKNGSPKRIYNNVKDSHQIWSDFISDNLNKIKEWGDLNLNGLSKGPAKFKDDIGSEFVIADKTIDKEHILNEWYTDNKLKGVPNHQSRSHLTQDLTRYLFAGLYVEKNKEFPRLKDFAKHHKTLIPDHANVESGKFTDRFRVQVPDKPATTVTSHISKDGHYFIHYDPKQCRSLTVREAARIQTFPDNYLFRGSRTAQFHQVGNAVPPYLAKKIATIVHEIFKNDRN